MRISLLARFLGYVKKTDDCWLWTGAIASSGYGQLRYARKAVNAHRLSYELFVGPIPAGHFICHHCDVRACVNPDHLFAGTPKDNATDMAKKGRWGGPRNLPKGSAIKVAKLTEAQVLAIKTALKDRPSQPQLARQYGVSTTTINNIAHGKIWRHVQC